MVPAAVAVAVLVMSPPRGSDPAFQFRVVNVRRGRPWRLAGQPVARRTTVSKVYNAVSNRIRSGLRRGQMTVRGADLLGEADLASLARASGIALESYRQAHVSACVARALARYETPSVAGLARLCRRDPAVRATLRRSILV